MPTHVIVGCGKSKRDGPTEARDLYTANYRKPIKKYARVVGDFDYIFSAKHGIIPGDLVIEPYDVRASDVPDDVLRDRVDDTIDDGGPGNRWSRVDRVVVCAGMDYVEPTRDIFEDRIDADADFPFQDVEGMVGNGAQAAWCKQRVADVTNAGVDEYL
jgi:hypothetical protein